MPYPSPTSAWKFLRTAAKIAGRELPPVALYLSGLLDDSGESADLEWRRFVVKCTRSSPSGTSEDAAQFKVDLVNITGGAVDASWTAADYAAVKTKLDTMLTALKPEVGTVLTFSEYRAYRMRFDLTATIPAAGSGLPYRPFLQTGPPTYVAAAPGAGTGAGAEPYQVATSVTFRTAWPQHWGRAYLPSPWHSGGYVDSFGRIVPAHRTAVANAFHTAFSGLADVDFLPVVPVTQVAKQPYFALLNVTDVVVDDVPDVQRRRRAKHAAARTIGV